MYKIKIMMLDAKEKGHPNIKLIKATKINLMNKPFTITNLNLSGRDVFVEGSFDGETAKQAIKLDIVSKNNEPSIRGALEETLKTLESHEKI